ncbi:MAG: hypothetical protein J5671_09190 [Bacteroidaceae bacterium]|nr:hypothetical protein [Bacteroidaceae bacterium]
MTQRNLKSAACGNKFEGKAQLVSDEPHVRNHYYIYNGYQNSLTRRAKYLIEFLIGHIPERNVLYVKREFETESRGNQNMMANYIFGKLIDSIYCHSLEDERLQVKSDGLARMIIGEANPFNPNKYE